MQYDVDDNDGDDNPTTPLSQKTKRMSRPQMIELQKLARPVKRQSYVLAILVWIGFTIVLALAAISGWSLIAFLFARKVF